MAMICKKLFARRPQIGLDSFLRSVCSLGHLDQLTFALTSLHLQLDKYALEAAGDSGNVSILDCFINYETKRGMSAHLMAARLDPAFASMGRIGALLFSSSLSFIYYLVNLLDVPGRHSCV